MLIGLAVAASERAFSQEHEIIWTIGPMFHYNFGGEKRTTSFGIEAAYWDVTHFPYGVDAAIEFDRNRIRLYSEAQTGVGLVGISLGPVVEFNTKAAKVHLGVQGSGWANYFLGVDYRFRYIDKTKYHCVGLYAKIPFATSGIDSSSGSSHSHSHSWDWD